MVLIIADILIDARCKAILTDGRWARGLWDTPSSQTWTPPGCMLHSYTPSDAQTCLSNRNVTFLGDSTARQLFWATAGKLDHGRALNASAAVEKHRNITFQVPEQAEVTFVWDPFLNATNSFHETSPLHHDEYDETVNIVVVGAGLWFATYLNSSYLPEFTNAVEHTMHTSLLDSTPLPSAVANNSSLSKHFDALFLPLSISDSVAANLSRSRFLTSERAHSLNDVLIASSPFHGVESLQSYSKMVDGTSLAFKEDSIHLQDTISSLQAEVLLNYMCNKIITVPSRQSHAYCCSQLISPNLIQKILLLAGGFAVVLNWSLILFMRAPSTPSCKDLPSLGHVSRLGQAIAIISFAVLYCFAADRTVIFEKVPKVMDENLFLCLAFMSLLLGLATFRQTHEDPGNPNDAATLKQQGWQYMSRGQTEEWKGWMQIAILLYHYFGLSKILWVYQFVRLLVSAYLFMTGFGHSTYFITTADFSLRRVMTVLLRTNLLSILLAFVMGTQYDLYYFPALSSLWFLIVWATFPESPPSGLSESKLLFRIAVSATIVTIITLSNQPIEKLLTSIDQIGFEFLKIDGHEFLFRFSLDAYVGYFGMVAAVLNSRCKGSQHRELEEVTARPFLSRRISVPLAVLVLVSYTVLCGQFGDKQDYNKWHPIVSPLPVLAFAVLRNSTNSLCASHSRLFAWFGRCSLETFVLQYHIWLAADSRGLLRLGLPVKESLPSQGQIREWYDMVEAVIVSAVFLWISYGVSTALPVITTSIIGETNNKDCLQRWQSENGTESKATQPASRRRGFGLATKVLAGLCGLWALNVIWHHVE